MKKTVLSFLMAIASLWANAQLNMTLADQINYAQGTSSLWGYIDPEDGTEYAAVGTRTGVSVVDLSDPNNVVEIAFKPDQMNSNSLWREVKSYGHYIYSVTEAGGGLQVINMTDPNNVTSVNWAPNIPGLGVLNKIHSITVDEFGYLYLNGSNLNSGGPIIVDVSADNGNPVYAGKLPAIYAHDSYARNNIIYTSDIYVGNFKVYDITDKANPVLLAIQQTPYNFTHNTWLNDAGDVIFTTDEKANAPVGVYDISDLNNIKELDQFRPVATVGQGVIPHNVHVWNDWVVTAYYTEGTIIIDGSRPENMIEVGNFDSFVSQSAGFYGVWGVYPYFPSGLVIASDMQNGLLVYNVNYVRACWLEGKVTNAITGANVSGASVSIASAQPNAATSDLLGNYKTGQAIPGVFDVTVTAAGYFPKTVQATLENDVLTLLDVALEPLDIDPFPPFTYTTPTTGCEPLELSFGENSGVGAAWAWSFEGGTPATSTEQNPTVQFSPGTHSVSLTVTTEGGNSYSLSNTDFITVAPAANASFNTSVDSLTVSFANASTGYNSLVWLFGDGETSTETNPPPHTYAQQGNYIVRLTVNGDCGSDVFTQVVQIGPFVPSAIFGADITTGCAPLTVTFTDQSTNSPTAWEWSFPGGEPAFSTEQNPTVTFSQGGLYNVGLAVSNAAGSDDVMWFDYITLDEGPTAGFSSAANGLAVQFTNSATGNDITHVWDFGDGQSSAELNPSHIYAASGMYNVSLTVNNACGTSTVSELITISNNAPTAAFNVDITSGCAPLTVAYTDASAGSVTGWQWTFPGGTPASSTEQNPVVTYANAGTYGATLHVENTWGNSESSQMDLISINGVPSGDFNYTVNGTTVAFVNNSNNALNYTWEFNDGAGGTSTELNPIYTFFSAGNYEVVLTATNACGTASYTGTVVISPNAPIAAFTLDYTGECAPLQVQFTDQSGGEPTAWQWSFPGGTPSSSTEQHPVVVYNEAGSFDVTLTVTNTAGTSEMVMASAINVGVAPQAGFTVQLNDFTATFSNTSTNAQSYVWDFGDGNNTSTEANPVHTYASNGTYTVSLTATNDCGTSTTTFDVIIQLLAPNADFAGLADGVCAPVTVEFFDQSTGDVTSWEWTFPGGNPPTSTEQNPVVVYNSPGVYDVDLVVTGPGGTDALEFQNVFPVYGPPTIGFDFTVTDLAVSFANTSINADTYAWDFGDGVGTVSVPNPEYQYAAPGTYQVTLTISNECGTEVLTQTVVATASGVGDSPLSLGKVTASPNPFSERMTLNYELEKPFEAASLIITNMLGDLVQTLPILAPVGQMEIGHELGSGVYFLHLVADGQTSNALRVVRL
ncbi:MAG: choice-of-anchor B family protein [Saprospiraceae bacterium]|nr:choice-of-anchor B family protein [Saprospiraceae bacterium]